MDEKNTRLNDSLTRARLELERLEQYSQLFRNDTLKSHTGLGAQLVVDANTRRLAQLGEFIYHICKGKKIQRKEIFEPFPSELATPLSIAGALMIKIRHVQYHGGQISNQFSPQDIDQSLELIRQHLRDILPRVLPMLTKAQSAYVEQFARTIGNFRQSTMASLGDEQERTAIIDDALDYRMIRSLSLASDALSEDMSANSSDRESYLETKAALLKAKGLRCMLAHEDTRLSRDKLREIYAVHGKILPSQIAAYQQGSFLNISECSEHRMDGHAGLVYALKDGIPDTWNGINNRVISFTEPPSQAVANDNHIWETAFSTFSTLLASAIALTGFLAAGGAVGVAIGIGASLLAIQQGMQLYDHVHARTNEPELPLTRRASVSKIRNLTTATIDPYSYNQEPKQQDGRSWSDRIENTASAETFPQR